MNRKLLAAVYEKTDGHCWYCGAELPPFSNWEIDHQMPRSKGGVNDLWNLVAACRQCNARKSDMMLGEYEEHLVGSLISLIDNAFNFSRNLIGPDIPKVKEHLEEARRYLYDTQLVFWGDGAGNTREDFAEYETECDATDSVTIEGSLQ